MSVPFLRLGRCCVCRYWYLSGPEKVRSTGGWSLVLREEETFRGHGLLCKGAWRLRVDRDPCSAVLSLAESWMVSKGAASCRSQERFSADLFTGSFLPGTRGSAVSLLFLHGSMRHARLGVVRGSLLPIRVGLHLRLGRWACHRLCVCVSGVWGRACRRLSIPPSLQPAFSSLSGLPASQRGRDQGILFLGKVEVVLWRLGVPQEARRPGLGRPACALCRGRGALGVGGAR